MKKLSIIVLIAALLLVIPTSSSMSQIQIYQGPEVTPVDLVECILEEGMIYDNVTFQGANVSRGIFTNGQTTNLGLETGIFLTSGAGSIIPGPNNSSNAGVNNGTPGNPVLNSITTSTTYDASVLEFDIIPASDTIRFTYVYGTEEDEWVGSSYNDVFGFFVTGPNPAGGMYTNHNIGFIPDFEDFIENTQQTLQYDLFTVVMTGKLPVIGAEEYHILIGIADCGDQIFDSGVFIAENSIYAGTHIEVTEILSPPGLTVNMVEGHVDADIIFHLQNTDFTPVTVYYSIEGDATNGVDYEEINDEIYFAEGQDSAIIHITPIQDGVIEGDETIRLIIFNTLGGIMVMDTVAVIIGDYVELSDNISPPTLICEGCEVTLWVDVMNGYPPYSYLWEPGGFTTDSITASPDTTTTYIVTYYDLFGESGMDSIKVVVFPVTEFSSFGFEVALNPGLAFDVTGEFSGDTIQLHLPEGTNNQNLIASYTFNGEYIVVTANGIPQEPGVTPNDFTNPVIYIIISPEGCGSEWVVITDIETGINETSADQISIYPNPSEGQFTIGCFGCLKSVQVSITDITGRLIVHDILSGINKTGFDLTRQPKGIYFLHLTSEEKSKSYKIVIR